jgi:hypothetical protein
VTKLGAAKPKRSRGLRHISAALLHCFLNRQTLNFAQRKPGGEGDDGCGIGDAGRLFHKACEPAPQTLEQPRFDNSPQLAWSRKFSRRQWCPKVFEQPLPRAAVRAGPRMFALTLLLCFKPSF